MANQFRVFTTMEEFSDPQEVKIDAVLAGGASTFNFGAPYVTIPAGRYRIIGFMQQIGIAAKTWLHAELNALITAGTLTLVGTLPDVVLSIDLSNEPNETRIVLTIDDDTGCVVTATGDPVVFQSVTLTRGVWKHIGLFPDDPATPTISVFGPVPQFNGMYQPRSVYVYDRSEEDGGQIEEAGRYITHKLADGGIKVYEVGVRVTTQAYRIIDLDPDVSGPPYHIGQLASINGNRTVLTFANPDATVLSGIADNLFASSLIVDGLYLLLNGYAVRILEHDSVARTITLAEPVPAEITVDGGEDVRICSEAHAMWTEALRCEMIALFQMDENTGEVLYAADRMAIDGSQPPIFNGVRRDIGNQLYSVQYNFLRYGR